MGGRGSGGVPGGCEEGEGCSACSGLPGPQMGNTLVVFGGWWWWLRWRSVRGRKRMSYGRAEMEAAKERVQGPDATPSDEAN